MSDNNAYPTDPDLWAAVEPQLNEEGSNWTYDWNPRRAHDAELRITLCTFIRRPFAEVFSAKAPQASALARELQHAEPTHDLFEPLRKRFDAFVAGDMNYRNRHFALLRELAEVVRGELGIPAAATMTEEELKRFYRLCGKPRNSRATQQAAR